MPFFVSFSFSKIFVLVKISKKLHLLVKGPLGLCMEIGKELRSLTNTNPIYSFSQYPEKSTLGTKNS